MRICVATGGAAHSDTAVRMAATIARETGSRLLILTVIGGSGERVRAERVLEHAIELAGLPPERVETRIRTGRPAVEIVREGRENQYDLIVLGERPIHRFVKRLLGPTAERVISHAPSPVLLARHAPASLERLLLCEGGRDPSLMDRMLRQLEPILRAFSVVTVLHVMSQIAAAPRADDWELRAEAEALMERKTVEGQLLTHDVEALAEMPLELRPRVRHGLVLDEILAEAREGNYDLVVIGAHQGRGWERFLLDDLAHQILMGTSCSVLVI